MIDHNHFICHFIFGGHLLNIPKKTAVFTRKTAVLQTLYQILIMLLLLHLLVSASCVP